MITSDLILGSASVDGDGGLRASLASCGGSGGIVGGGKRLCLVLVSRVVDPNGRSVADLSAFK